MPDASGSDPVRFARSLYAEQGVHTAAAAFAQVATLRVQGEDEHIVVHIDAVAEGLSPAVVRDELCNHALFHTVVAGRRASGSHTP